LALKARKNRDRSQSRKLRLFYSNIDTLDVVLNNEPSNHLNHSQYPQLVNEFAQYKEQQYPKENEKMKLAYILN
jgi:hypothetical protein